ncbi:MAG: nickel-responsive transcriptional regulator NikR [Bryobacteraceae bacterium]|nr:nickel-responsive transcriptional regulator NikR [Bryobacteraceae bacterium]
MSTLARIGVAMDAELLADFDAYLERRKYANRSEGFRDLVRDALIGEKTAKSNAPAVGTLTLVYDHHTRSLSEKLTAMQHEHQDLVVSTLHVHLDHHNCLEVLVLRGQAGRIRQLAEGIIATKGVQHGQLTLTTTA